MEESSKKAEVMEESSLKREADELQQESTKKQKMDDDHERAELQSLMNFIPDEEEIAVYAIPLATKPLSIVDWKIVKEGKISYYQIIRADGSLRRYSAFIQMHRSFDKEDLETLWKLVKAKHGYTRPYEGYERVLWGDLKTMFEHHVEDAVKRNLRESKVLVWKLFDSLIMEYLVNISKRHAFWSLNEDILKIGILETNTPYPLRKIQRIRACTHQRPQRNEDQYAVSIETQYAIFKILELGVIVLEEEVVPNVKEVSLVDGVFDGAFGGDGEEEVVIGEGVVVTSSSLEMLKKSCLGEMMRVQLKTPGLASLVLEEVNCTSSWVIEVSEGLGVQTLTPEEQEAADIMQALKESKKTSRRQPGTKPGVPNEEKVTSEEKVILEWGDEQESEYSDEDQGDDEQVYCIYTDEDDDDRSIDLELTDDEFVQGVKQVNDDEDENMFNAEGADSKKGDEDISSAAKADAEKTEEVKDEAKKAELPPTSSNLSVFSEAEISSLMDIKIQSEVPHIQSPSVLRVPVSVISKPLVLTSVQESPSVAPVKTLPPPSVSTIPHVPLQQQTAPIPTPTITADAPTITIVVSESDALNVVQLRVAELEKNVFEHKKIDLSVEALADLKTQVPIVVDDYLGSKVGDVFQKELQKHTAYLIHKYSIQPAPDFTKIQTPIADLEKSLEKSPSEILKIKREQAEKQKM
ncbi:hypothetical protein Tco_0823549 [Tanacetum coccineum]|uniref:Uncharacterized protein n=1 Tax=Tanacetum coccineum TaxID=301880 RepID=A0ABQ5AI82_9ASTR